MSEQTRTRRSCARVAIGVLVVGAAFGCGGAVGFTSTGGPQDASSTLPDAATADAATADAATADATASDAEAGRPVCEPAFPQGDASATAPWSWDFGDSDAQQGTGIFAGIDGSVYLAGQFAGVVDIGGGRWQGSDSSTRTANTDPIVYDSFIAKLDASGRRLWSRHFGSAVTVRAMGFAEPGTFVLAGTWTGTQDFGAGPVAANGRSTGFLVAFDACGNQLWMDRFGVGSDASGPYFTSLGVGRDGSVVTTGQFRGAIDLGGGPLIGDSSTDNATFIARYAPTGAHVWSRAFGTQLRNVVVALDADGNTYAAAEQRGAVDLGAGRLVASDGPVRILVVKLDPSGTPLWTLVDSDKPNGASYPLSVAVDAAGNLIMTGVFINRTVDFGNGVVQDYVGSGNNGFAAKVDGAGTPLWIHPFDIWFPAGIALGTRGIVAVTHYDDYNEVHWLDDSGAEMGSGWRWGGGYFSMANGVALDPSNAILVTGLFMGTLDLESGPMTTSGPGDIDGFVAKLPPL